MEARGSAPRPTIRRAAPGEAAALTALVLRSKPVWGYDAAFMAGAAAELALSEQDLAERDVLVAELDGTPAGVAAVAHAADPPELDFLFVEPRHGGTGVGKVLVQAACAAARERGIGELEIVSDPNAEAFYISQGAVRVGVRRSTSTGRDLPVLKIATAA